jgi:hypothetical protein
MPSTASVSINTTETLLNPSTSSLEVLKKTFHSSRVLLLKEMLRIGSARLKKKCKGLLKHVALLVQMTASPCH